MSRKIKTKAQSVLEFALFFGVVAIVLTAMSAYMRRAVQATVKEASDQFGTQENSAENLEATNSIKYSHDESQFVNRSSSMTSQGSSLGGGFRRDLNSITQSWGTSFSNTVSEDETE